MTLPYASVHHMHVCMLRIALLCSTRFRGAPSHFAGPGAQRAACVAGGCPYLVATLVNGQVWSFAKKPRATPATPATLILPTPILLSLVYFVLGYMSFRRNKPLLRPSKRACGRAPGRGTIKEPRRKKGTHDSVCPSCFCHVPIFSCWHTLHQPDALLL